MYITNNSLAVKVMSSRFSSITAAVSGGAIYAGRDVTQLVIEDSAFRNCSAHGSGDEDGGGAVFLGGGSHDAAFRGVTIQNCSAPAGSGGGILATGSEGLLAENVAVAGCSAGVGGGIAFYTGCSDAVLRDVQVSQSSAWWAGGAISVWQANERVRMTAVSLDQCTAGSSGGGLYLRSQNDFLALSNVNVTQCSSGGGGGVYLHQANLHVTMEAVAIRECSATYNGGGLSLYSANAYLAMQDVAVTGCSAGYGGGIHLYRDNAHVSVYGATIEECSARTSGGGIYVDTANAHLAVRVVAITACTAGYGGGGVMLNSANEHTTLTAVHIDQCAAERVGGGLFARKENSYLSLVTVRVTQCSVSGGNGGGVYLSQANLNVSMQHVSIEDCVAQGTGGGALIVQNNHFLFLRDMNITRCVAGFIGGGLTLYSGNTHGDVDGLRIKDCSAGGDGGGLLMMTGNHFLSLRNAEILRCKAERGGGLELYMDNVNVTIAAVRIEDCSVVSYGGGFHAVSKNDHLVLRNTNITECHALTSGGGISMGIANKHVQLVEVGIDRCSASDSDGVGGGIHLETQNDHLSLSHVHLTGCEAGYQGGGMYSVRNDDLSIIDSRMEHCSADHAGGGLMLSGAHTGVVIENSTISFNSAREMGGGVASLSETRDLVIAGCVLSGNEAYGQFGQGGGIYLGSGHIDFALLSAASYRHSVVIETEHPYQYSAQLLLNRVVAVPGAVGYYVYFDPLSKIGANDDCVIFGTPHRADNYFLFNAHDPSWPGVHGPPLQWPEKSLTLTLKTDSVLRTALSDNYYGVKLHVVPVFAGVEGPTVLEGNTAGEKGGGLYVASREQFPVLIGAQFGNNEAGSDGGGIYLRSEAVGMVAHQLVMEGNRAQDGYGGGLCASTGCYAMQAQNCTFTNNSAGYAGGALAFLSDNGVYGDLAFGNDNTVSSSLFALNSAAIGGGAVYLGINSALTVLNSVVKGNTAYGDGGGLMLSKKSRLIARHLTVAQNKARDCGGGIALQDIGTATISQSSLSGNVATAKGGAFCAKDGSLLSIGETEIALNAANRVGGALYCADSPYPVMWDTAIAGNAAKWGSALYFDGVTPSVNRNGWNVAVTGNQAAVGTVYWVNGTMPEPAEFSARFTYTGNTLLFGQEVATQATVVRVPERIIVQQYGAFLDPPLELRLLDRYGELSPASESAYVGVSILEESTLQCNGRPPFLSGSDVSAEGVAWQNGVAVFKSLGVTCYPGSNVTLLFTAHLADQVDLPAVQQIVSATAELHFRSCQVGEYIDNGKCAVCPSGSYSLEAVSEATRCKECPSKSEVESCHGADIVLQQRYWRRYAYSEAILPCLEDVDGCAGGNAAGDASCRQGYEGPLCSVCADGYYLSDAQCQPCTDAGRLAPASVLYIAIAAVAVGAVLAVLFYKSSRMYSGEASSVWESLYNVISWLIDEARSLQSQIKILITTFQICTTVHVSMKVTFPAQFTRYLNAMSVVNLNVVALVPLSCADRANYTFIDKLVMVTVGPIALSLLIALLGTVEYMCCSYRNRGHDAKEALNKVTSRYLTMFLFLTYLVLPYVATTIFQTFLCTDVGSRNEDSDAHDRYLTADMRISCDSDYYRSGVGYAAVMALLYVGGIPLMYALLLYRSRHEIAGRFTAPPATEGITAPLDTIAAAKAEDEHVCVSRAAGDVEEKHEGPVNYLEKRIDPAALQARMISFLYEAYEPQFWYWEVVETTRRLVLTAVLSVCGAGTGGQAVLALLLALLYIKLVGYYRPYLEDMDDMEAEVGQFQIFLTFLGALICQRHLVGSEYDSAVSGVMLAVNTSVSIMFTRNVLLKLREDVKNLRNLAQVFPKFAPLVGSFAVAESAKDSEHGLELPAFSENGDQDMAGVATTAGVVPDACGQFEAGDVDGERCEAVVSGTGQEHNSLGSTQWGEEVV
jgi:hypothetical protein